MSCFGPVSRHTQSVASHNSGGANVQYSSHKNLLLFIIILLLKYCTSSEVEVKQKQFEDRYTFLLQSF